MTSVISNHNNPVTIIFRVAASIYLIGKMAVISP